MRTTYLLSLACITSLGCSDDPAPVPPADVPIVYDIQAIDRPGDRPIVFQDTGPSDVNTDRGPERCQMSSFLPCECVPGLTGTRRCQTNGMFETTCRCAGFDAGPDDAPATDGAATDANGADGATMTDASSASDGSSGDATAVMDASVTD